jgi:hypothetical protein
VLAAMPVREVAVGDAVLCRSLPRYLSPQVQALALPDCNLFDEHVLVLLPLAAQLRKLDLSGNRAVTHAALHTLGEHLSQLVELDVSGTSRNPMWVASFAMHGKLRTLRMVTAIDARVFAAVLKQLPSLEHLCGSSYPTGVGIPADALVEEGHGKLQILDMRLSWPRPKKPEEPVKPPVEVPQVPAGVQDYVQQLQRDIPGLQVVQIISGHIKYTIGGIPTTHVAKIPPHIWKSGAQPTASKKTPRSVTTPALSKEEIVERLKVATPRLRYWRGAPFEHRDAMRHYGRITNDDYENARFAGREHEFKYRLGLVRSYI